MEQGQQPEVQFKWRAKEAAPEIYANYLNVSWTLFDVRFVLGQLVPSEPAAKEFVVEQRGSVTFAWPEAKILRDMLINIVARYEEANGEIKPLKLASAAPPENPVDKATH